MAARGPDYFGVGVLVQAGVDLQPGGRGGGGDQVDDGLAAGQRLGAPVDADVAEQAVLDRVLLAGPGRVMQHPDAEADLVGERLQLGLPQPSCDSCWSRRSQR